MRRASWMFIILLVLGALLVGPNALWLSRSSAMVHNTGNQDLTLRFAFFDQPARIIEIGTLAPGESRFVWLDPIGEATLVINVKDGEEWREHCANYIEQGMYRVEVNARSPTAITCDTDLVFFERLLILDYLS